jgi:hypothetical protein
MAERQRLSLLRRPDAFAERVEENPVADVVFTVLTIGFFVLAITYLRGCELLK